jgi:sugar lactone lactonase YvrE
MEITMIRRLLAISLGFLLSFLAAPWRDGSARAEYILAARYFTAGIDIYDPTTDTARNFITIQPSVDAFPGLTGLAYSSSLNRLFATANSSQRIYSFNAESGALIGYQQLSGSFAPAGIALDPSGDIYVADNNGSTVRRFTPNASNATLTSSGTIQLSGAAGNLNGLARTSGGQLLISAVNGTGLHRYDAISGQSTFSTSPIANGQVAISSGGSVAVGGVVVSSYVSLFDLAGNATGAIHIDSTYLPPPLAPYTSTDVTGPQGVAFDGSGNLIVTAMGRTNPFSPSDNFQSNGGIFIFDSTGTTLLDSLVNTTPYTGVIVAPVPEPSAVVLGGLAIGVCCWHGLRKRRGASA